MSTVTLKTLYNYADDVSSKQGRDRGVSILIKDSNLKKIFIILSLSFAAREGWRTERKSICTYYYSYY